MGKDTYQIFLLQELIKKMEEINEESGCKIIHVQIIDGTQADIFEIGNALKKFKETLPFRLEAIVTNDKVTLRDVDALINELWKLKKQLKKENIFKVDVK